MNKYSTILFDLDMTILDFDRCERDALKEAFTAFGINPDDELLKSYHEINKACWKELELKLIDRGELAVKRFRITLLQNNIKGIDPVELGDCYKKNLAQYAYFMPGAKEMLKDAASKYKLYLITNGSTIIQNSRIKIAGISDLFEDIFISESIGHDKPSVEFFDCIRNRIAENDLSKMLIVGDSLSSDIKLGINVGIDTVLFDCKDRLDKQTKCAESTYQVNGYCELRRLLNDL